MIDAKLRLFIPSRAIALPVPLTGAYDGDGRTFSYDQGTSRAEIWIDIDNSLSPAHPITIKRLAFGRTAEYTHDQIQDVLGMPFWWKDVKRDPFLNTDPQPIAVATAEVKPETLSVNGVFEPGPFGITPFVRVKFHVEGKNPLEPIAPPFNLDFDLLVSAAPLPFFNYSLTGSHDGFPCYELYLNQRLVYSYSPISGGTTPLSLFAMGDIHVNIPTTVFI